MTEIHSRLAGNSKASLVLYRFGRGLCVGFCRVWLRLSVEGREHVPPDGAFVLAPVHRSNMDTPIAAVCTKRRMRYMGKDSLWKVRCFGWLLSALGGFPVSRGTIDREALARCTALLEAGQPIVVFPEGQRQAGPIVQPLFDGAAYLAIKTQVPIVPVGIGGSERVMPKGSKIIWPRKVHVVVGRPLPPPALEGTGARVNRQSVRDLTADLHERLQELFDTAQVRAGA
ncbi:MAG: lysophospholipid acyltransferase family protein [Acidimicrobiales bacterium]